MDSAFIVNAAVRIHFVIKISPELQAARILSGPFTSTSFLCKVKLSHYTPWRHLGGRGGIAPTHS
jgi:hypothetical protein